jgi:FtsP/CotA-like multicopper oxidase with cupredoxin domain
MDARAGTFLVNGKPVKGLKTFNGTYPGPTLAMKPGDHVEIAFINHLNEPTNLHFHGFRVTPANVGDNVLRMMAPAVTTKELKAGLHYKIAFTIPKDHQQFEGFLGAAVGAGAA